MKLFQWRASLGENGKNPNKTTCGFFVFQKYSKNFAGTFLIKHNSLIFEEWWETTTTTTLHWPRSPSKKLSVNFSLFFSRTTTRFWHCFRSNVYGQWTEWNLHVHFQMQGTSGVCLGDMQTRFHFWSLLCRSPSGRGFRSLGQFHWS